MLVTELWRRPPAGPGRVLVAAAASPVRNGFADGQRPAARRRRRYDRSSVRTAQQIVPADFVPPRSVRARLVPVRESSSALPRSAFCMANGSGGAKGYAAGHGGEMRESEVTLPPRQERGSDRRHSYGIGRRLPARGARAESVTKRLSPTRPMTSVTCTQVSFALGYPWDRF